MKKVEKLPGWVVAAALSAVILVVAFLGWRSLSPNDPAMDGHNSKVFTPEDMARFRSQDARRSSGTPGGSPQ